MNISDLEDAMRKKYKHLSDMRLFVFNGKHDEYDMGFLLFKHDIGAVKVSLEYGFSFECRMNSSRVFKIDFEWTNGFRNEAARLLKKLTMLKHDDATSSSNDKISQRGIKKESKETRKNRSRSSSREANKVDSLFAELIEENKRLKVEKDELTQTLTSVLMANASLRSIIEQNRAKSIELMQKASEYEKKRDAIKLDDIVEKIENGLASGALLVKLFASEKNKLLPRIVPKVERHD